MDYHLTTEAMDLARQLRDLELDWPYGTGDHFCVDDDVQRICVNFENVDGEIVVFDREKNRFPLRQVAWIPKRSQAIEWLTERHWRLTFDAGGQFTRIEAINEKKSAAPVMEGIGHNELEALLELMSNILELDMESHSAS